MFKDTFFRRVSKTNTVAKLTSVFVSVIGLATAALLPMSVSAAGGTNYTLSGDASLVSPGYNSPTAAQTVSSTTVPPNYGNVDFGVPSGITDLNSLSTLSTEYMFTQGSCGLGAPRFTVGVTTPSGPANMFVYIGAYPNYNTCPDNAWINTGNLLASGPTNFVDTSQLGGKFYDTYANAQANFGSYPVTDISLNTDGGTATNTQVVEFDNVHLNNTTVTFESKDTCKNGGWQQYTSAPGPFKNQGDCVSYYASGGNS